MTRPAHSCRIDVITANIEYHDPVPELREALEQDKPDLAFIQQANPAVPWLHTLPGYNLRRVGDTAEAHDLAMLVRKGHRVTRQTPIAVPGSGWTGPIHGLEHGPKIFHGALVNDLFWAVNVHIPTRTPASNAEARRRCFDRLAEFAEHHPHRPLLMGGDWNTGKADLRPFAERIGARVAGEGIDLYVFRDMGLVGKPAGVPRPRDTHGWVRATFEIGDNR